MTSAETRAAALVEFRARAAAILRAQPEMRSVMLALAQYWENLPHDEVHTLLVASPRDTPVWPHLCPRWARVDPILPTPGEECSDRRGPDDWFRVDNAAFRVDNAAFEAFCHEHGNERYWDHHSFLPFAIARRAVGGEIELEIVGKLLRPAQEIMRSGGERAPSWLALPRARALYALVCARPADDGPRRVLADYLLEHEHPYGEYIALALAGELDAAAIARRDALLAAHGSSWLGALDEVVPPSSARWERGFLARADVFCEGSGPRASGAVAWGTVEAIRFLGSADVIDPAMTALRDVGPVRGDGLVALAAAPRPWAIERLHAALEQPTWATALWSATTLPRLRHLVLSSLHIDDALRRPRAAWWPQLERLTLWMPALRENVFSPEPLAKLLARAAGAAPWVAVTRQGVFANEPGWEVAIGPGGQIEISLAGWHEEASPRALVEIVDELPREAPIALVPSRYWTPTAEDVARISARTRRRVRGGSR